MYTKKSHSKQSILGGRAVAVDTRSGAEHVEQYEPVRTDVWMLKSESGRQLLVCVAASS
jgi:hypothetical protein